MPAADRSSKRTARPPATEAEAPCPATLVPVTVVQSRVLRVAVWVAAVVGVVLLVLTFVLREYSYRFHPDLIHALMSPVPAVVVVALLAGVLVAGGLVYACVEGEGQIPPHRGHRRAGTAAAGAAGLGVVVVVGLTTDRAGGAARERPQPGSTEPPLSVPAPPRRAVILSLSLSLSLRAHSKGLPG